MSKKPPSPVIGESESIGKQQQGAGQSNINAASSAVSGFEANPTQNPLYKALYSTEAGQMSSAYDNAAANTSAKANAAGFGYQQPTAQGAQGQLRGQEASAIGQLPGQVEQQVAPQVMQGAQIQGNLGTSELNAGNQMFASADPLEQQYQQYSQNYVPMWQRLVGGAVGMVPGASGLGNAISSA